MDVHCETECKLELIDRIATSHDHLQQEINICADSIIGKKSIGTVFIPLLVLLIGIMGGGFTYSLSSSNEKDKKQDKKTESIEETQHNVLQRLPAIEVKLEHLEEQIRAESERSKKVDQIIMEKLDALRDSY